MIKHAGPTELLDTLNYGNAYIHHDASVNLTAIIALHNTQLGPAIGGCRCLTYKAFDAALNDALKLGQAMTLKAAIHGLAHGGGKAVILAPEQIEDRGAFFASFGRFVNQLSGQYITAVDSGTTQDDMEFIAQETEHVLASSKFNTPCNPSYYTALGVIKAIQGAALYCFGHDDLSNLKVAVQGLGQVGMYLCENLNALGAQLIVSDIDTEQLDQVCSRFEVEVVNPGEIYAMPVDVFSPCALGGVLNHETCQKIQAKIVAGSANNQCEKLFETSMLLNQKGIIYIPDYLSNGGGLIHVAGLYAHNTEAQVLEKIDHIKHTTQNLLLEAEKHQQSMEHIAYDLALHALLPTTAA